MITPRQRKAPPMVPGLKLPPAQGVQALQDFSQYEDCWGDETSYSSMSDHTASVDSHPAAGGYHTLEFVRTAFLSVDKCF